jgi:hypothetical protein
MAVIRNQNLKITCDYCRMQFKKEQLRSQTPAVWTVISSHSKVRYSHYCQDHALQVTHWACQCSDYRNCKNRWPLEEQVKYTASIKEITLDV